MKAQDRLLELIAYLQKILLEDGTQAEIDEDSLRLGITLLSTYLSNPPHVGPPVILDERLAEQKGQLQGPVPRTGTGTDPSRPHRPPDGVACYPASTSCSDETRGAGPPPSASPPAPTGTSLAPTSRNEEMETYSIQQPSTIHLVLSPPGTGATTAPALLIERERSRIAHDIHDGSMQQIGYVIHRLEFIHRILEEQPQVALHEIDRSSGILQESLEDLRRSVSSLLPVQLEEQGFEAALRGLLENLASNDPELEIRYEPGNAGIVPPSLEVPIFRFVQEALNNVHKHAQANRVTLRMRRFSGQLLVQISDDGNGFLPHRQGSLSGGQVSRAPTSPLGTGDHILDVLGGRPPAPIRGDAGKTASNDAGASPAAQSGQTQGAESPLPSRVGAELVPALGLGLRSMRERIEQAGGFLEVRSRPGEGTTLKARFPLDKAEGGSTAGRAPGHPAWEAGIRHPVAPLPATGGAELVPALGRDKVGPYGLLTKREREVLRLLVEGLTNRAIAGRLSVSIETVKSHVHSIMQKMHVKDRTQAAVVATRHSLDQSGSYWL